MDVVRRVNTLKLRRSQFHKSYLIITSQLGKYWTMCQELGKPCWTLKVLQEAFFYISIVWKKIRSKWRYNTSYDEAKYGIDFGFKNGLDCKICHSTFLKRGSSMIGCLWGSLITFFILNSSMVFTNLTI